LRFHGGDLVCQQCHGRIAPDEQFCAQCHAVILRRYCPGCRKLVPEHARICPYCGTKATEKSKRPVLIDRIEAVPTILVLFFVALLLLLVDQKRGQETPSDRMDDHGKVATAPPSGSSHQQAIQTAEEKIITSGLQKSAQNIAAKNVKKGAILNLKGHTLIKQGRYREAVPLLYKAIETFPEDTRTIDYVFAQYNLGHSLRKIGKSDEAIPYLERCVVYDRQNRMFQRELQAARRDLTRKDNT
jgi:tetratricopeptide (TPR) repeat protein/RNA polymerase subunit RPABC4/transcription elongation factor Spt4